VHYNLFLRGQKLGELLAATYVEREAVAIWREMIALASAPAGVSPELRAAAAEWRAELKRIAENLKELEDQCCPPDEAAMREPVWTPPGEVDPRKSPTQAVQP
jgi:hypothetical protein